jgi:predicted ATPase
MQLVPVLFELGARPHPPAELYRAYLEQSHVFVGVYWQSYGWIAPGETRSGIEDEYALSEGMPRLLYVKEPAPEREQALQGLLDRLENDGSASYKRFTATEELGRLVASDLALLLTERFGHAPSASAAPTLPSPLTSFVGRDDELERIEQLIRGNGARLITITGPGGIGKTRLAIEAARRLGGSFANGTVFVPLEGIQDDALVQTAIATAIGSRNLAADPVASLCASLHDKRLLLVLDNFEHVVEAAPLVGTLLEQSPHLVVLATSRKLLHLRGEHELHVPPLSPAREAVELFAERIAAARHGFELDDDDAAVVAQICRRLDGVPLAIELAAPQLRLLSADELLAGLNRRLEIAGPRDAPERQRTLEAAIAWSYELLEEDERAMFDRLGVFRGSFTLAAAAEVAESRNALDLLASLLDQSMVYRLRDADEPRFALLTMIREYAVERLEQTGELDGAMERLCRHHLVLAGEAEPGLRSRKRPEWVRRLELEIDSMRATLAWLGEQGRGGEVVALVRGLWLYWWQAGQIDEARGWIDQTLECDLPPAERGLLTGLDGMFAFVQGDPVAATERIAAARPLLTAPDDRFVLALVGGVSGIITTALGDLEQGRVQMADCLAGFEAIGDDWGVALASSSIVWLQTMTECYDETDAAFLRSLATAERAGDDLLLAMAHENLATRRLHEGDIEGTRVAIRKAIELVEGAGIVYIRPDLLESLSRLAVLEGLPELAAERLGAASALREAMRVPLWGAALERVERRESELREALGDERFEAALERGRAARFADVSAPPESVLRPRAPERARSPA